jgi:hypothetical protein
LVEFDAGGGGGEGGLGGAALEDEFLRLDHAGFEEGRETGGVAGEEGFLEDAEAFGDLGGGGGFFLSGEEGGGEDARAVAQGGLEAGEAEFGEGDIAVGDGFAEGETAGPLEGLRERNGPGGALTGEGAGGADAFVAGGYGEFRDRRGCRRLGRWRGRRRVRRCRRRVRDGRRRLRWRERRALWARAEPGRRLGPGRRRRRRGG